MVDSQSMIDRAPRGAFRTAVVAAEIADPENCGDYRGGGGGGGGEWSPRYLGTGCHPGVFTWHPAMVGGNATTSRSRGALRLIDSGDREGGRPRARVPAERSRPPLLIRLQGAHFGPNGRADLRGIKRDGVS